MSELIDDDAGVARVGAACRAAGELALDLEFVSEARMRPELGLVQVAWIEGDEVVVAAIDPAAADPRPVLALIEELPVIAHAARQDLQLLAARFGLRAARLFDTQIAAAFVGLGDQVGYGRLVEELAGVRLDKDVQFTDWLRRPLSARQLDYALDDVRYLPEIAEALRARLDEVGRAAWVGAECATLAEVAWTAARQSADEAWRDVAGARRLRGPDRAALVRLAGWRWRLAEARNKPPTWLCADKVLVEIAQRRPRDEAELARIRGAGEVARLHAAEVLTELALAAAVDVAAEPVPAAGPAVGPRVALWEEVFVALVQAAAERTRIPARWIAARAECEELARWLDRDDPRAGAHPLVATWRREVVGETLLAWIRGDVTLAADRASPAGVRVVPRAPQP